MYQNVCVCTSEYRCVCACVWVHKDLLDVYYVANKLFFLLRNCVIFTLYFDIYVLRSCVCECVLEE